ncbi:MAG: aminotransferase class I/II-fold pyridoxal phosphate-dependent enzyme [Clostridia bacterium]|nr:aminotransferase class I/II-fold pyridoxal phosphate-dependent enzyme [Clostridia bacterium]
MISTKLADVFSDIRGELYYRALEKEREGEKILKLNTGNPAAFGFPMPDSVRETLLSSVDGALGYCDLKGMAAAREAIVAYHSSLGVRGVTANDVYITNGVSEAAYLAATALCSDGDEFLMPSPCYSLWVNMVKLAGGRAVFYDCDEKSGWQPDLASVRKNITPKTKAILLINPNNPTGAVYDRRVVEEMYKIAKEHDLVILSDEIYDRLILDGICHTPTASLGDEALVLTFNGLSKSHCLCGFRSGWLVVSGPEDKKRQMNTALTTLTSIRLCSNALMQLVVPAALADTAYTRAMMLSGEGRVAVQSRVAFEELTKIEGIEVVKNKAAFYLFPKIDLARFGFESDKDFAMQLLESKNILVVAGSGFYCKDNCHFRIVALPRAEELKEAIGKIGEFLDEKRI